MRHRTAQMPPLDWGMPRVAMGQRSRTRVQHFGENKFVPSGRRCTKLSDCGAPLLGTFCPTGSSTYQLRGDFKGFRGDPLALRVLFYPLVGGSTSAPSALVDMKAQLAEGSIFGFLPPGLEKLTSYGVVAYFYAAGRSPCPLIQATPFFITE